jgi:hypothetical protein
MSLSVAPPTTTTTTARTGFPLKSDDPFGQNSRKYDDPFGQFSSNQNGSFGPNKTKSRFDRGEGSGGFGGLKRPHQQQQWNEPNRSFDGKRSRFDDSHSRSSHPPNRDSRWSQSGNKFGNTAANNGHQPSSFSRGFQDNRTQMRSGHQQRPPLPPASGNGSHGTSSFHGHSSR